MLGWLQYTVPLIWFIANCLSCKGWTYYPCLNFHRGASCSPCFSINPRHPSNTPIKASSSSFSSHIYLPALAGPGCLSMQRWVSEWAKCWACLFRSCPKKWFYSSQIYLRRGCKQLNWASTSRCLASSWWSRRAWGGCLSNDSLVLCSMLGNFRGHFVSLLFGVYEKFFVKHPVYDISFQCDIVLLFELLTGLRVSSQPFKIQNIQLWVFLCVGFWWATACVCASVCWSVAVGGERGWQHCQILWDLSWCRGMGGALWLI